MRSDARSQPPSSPHGIDGPHRIDNKLVVFAGSWRRSDLWAHLPIEVLGVENMIVQVGDPLAS